MIEPHGGSGGSLADLVERHFGGDRELYEWFVASCQSQFVCDVQAGDDACAAGDGAALRRLAHSLKTVLTSLGQEGPATAAEQVEALASAGELAAAQPLWLGLRIVLLQFAESGLRPA